MKQKLTTYIDGDIVTIQRADYIEDGWYIEVINKEITLWEIPYGGGEPYKIDTYESIQEAVKAGEALT